MVANVYDFWLLDLDGTLVDVEDSYVQEVVGEVGNRLGYDFSEEEARRIWHGLGSDPNQPIVDAGLDPGRFWETFHEVEDPTARAEATFIYDDASFVADLDRPVGLVTHCQRHLTDPVLNVLDIRDWFDSVVCCTDETGWKPDPTPVELAVANLDVAGDGVLAGDGAHDVGAAWNAGLDAVHVERHGHDVRRQCVLGDHRVEGFHEL